MSAELSREVVDALAEFIVNEWEMDLFTGLSVSTLDAWLSPESGEYANSEARAILCAFAPEVGDEIEDAEQMGRDGEGNGVFAYAPRILAYYREGMTR